MCANSASNQSNFKTFISNRIFELSFSLIIALSYYLTAAIIGDKNSLSIDWLNPSLRLQYFQIFWLIFGLALGWWTLWLITPLLTLASRRGTPTTASGRVDSYGNVNVTIHQGTAASDLSKEEKEMFNNKELHAFMFVFGFLMNISVIAYLLFHGARKIFNNSLLQLIQACSFPYISSNSYKLLFKFQPSIITSHTNLNLIIVLIEYILVLAIPTILLVLIIKNFRKVIDIILSIFWSSFVGITIVMLPLLFSLLKGIILN